MSLYEMFTSNGENGFGYGTTAEQATDGLSLEGKTMLVTGCNSGLGLEAMRVLALRGARVIGTARSLEKAKEACASVKGSSIPMACELSDPKSVRACVAEVKAQGLKLDAIIANAGIMALPKLEKTFGVEQQLFTNHIGHFMLVTGLLEQLTDEGRVVMLTSSAHTMAPKGGIEFDNLAGDRNYGAWKMYGQSKMANLLFAKELARRFEGTKKTANAVHPGVIRTNLGRHMSPVMNAVGGVLGSLFQKSVPQGAATEVFVAASPKAAGISGKYWADVNVAKPRSDAEDAAVAKKLWDVSEEIVSKLA